MNETAASGLTLEFDDLVHAYKDRFDEYPPVFFMPEDLAIEVMKSALRDGVPAPLEDWPDPGCNCR